MEWNKFFINILVHVGMMALFLTIFYFTIAQYFEKKIIKEQIDFVINNFVGNSFKSISNESKEKIKNQINQLFNNINFDKQDEEVKEENSKIKNKAWIFVGILLV